MPLPVLSTALDFAFSIIDIVRGAFFLSIPLFIAVFLGSFLHKKLAEKFKLSWFNSALITALIFSLALVSIAYLFPLFYSFQAEDLGVKPPELQPDLSDYLQLASISIYKVLAGSIIVTVMALPFVLLGGLVKDALGKKKFNKYICLYASVFLCCLIASVLFLFFFGWVLQGMLYFLYS